MYNHYETIFKTFCQDHQNRLRKGDFRPSSRLRNSQSEKTVKNQPTYQTEETKKQNTNTRNTIKEIRERIIVKYTEYFFPPGFPSSETGTQRKFRTLPHLSQE